MINSDFLRNLGASVNKDRTCDFSLWAPFAKQIWLCLLHPHQKKIEMHQDIKGYWHLKLENCIAGTHYLYQLDDKFPLPDPASLCQPLGVHGPSEVIDLEKFKWTDGDWQNIPLEQMIFYELHTGTFTEEGNFDGIIRKLDYLLDLGINTIQLMPAGQFPGARNWGYDGVYPYAVQKSYGGHESLMNLVNTCHQKGIAVFLDVIYNHLGPEGNYLHEYGPYFTERYKTPWGKAINYDDKYCNGVRNYVIQNALMWLRTFHLDGLRLDAVHAIYDFGAKHIMQELADQVSLLNHQTGKKHYLVAESALNDSRYINPPEIGGYGLDAQWNDDFHHSMHALVTGEQNGYYIDYSNPFMLLKAFTNGYAYEGEYSEFRKRNFGNSSQPNEGNQFIVFSQNHDMVGNRKFGERFSALVSFEMLKVIAGAVFVSPFLPMLFMGEEYGEKNPFLYFVNHSNEVLNKLVRRGRLNDFKSFYPGDNKPAPDPADVNTFTRSKLSSNPLTNKESKALFNYYKTLIHLKKTHPVLRRADKKQIKVTLENKIFTIERWNAESQIICWLNFSNKSVKMSLPETIDGKTAKLILCSSDKSWNGVGQEVPMNITGRENVNLMKESMLLYSI